MTTHSATTSVASQSIIVHPDNVLGRGVLAASTEAGLLADGMRFATVLVGAGQRDRGGYVRKRPLILCGRRCPTEAAQDGLRDMLGAQRRLVVAGPAQQLEAVA
ncbi:MAG: hypothetical protein KF753_05190 [Caldilineaceae bacterium]|nr:hypothetical protein [Caldilineaceae bacterium]